MYVCMYVQFFKQVTKFSLALRLCVIGRGIDAHEALAAVCSGKRKCVADKPLFCSHPFMLAGLLGAAAAGFLIGRKYGSK